MRRIFLPSLALTLVPFLAASAQESLCNPCVDPPLNRRDGPNGSIPIRREDMRNLGIMSIADMVRQLPSNATISPYGRPISLGSADAFPAPFAAVFAAAASHLQFLDYEPGKFSGRLAMCLEGRCILFVYPTDLGDASATTDWACPGGYCATIIYSLPEGRIVEIRD